MLKDEELSPKEYEVYKEQPFHFPFTYPTKNHPSAILLVSQIIVNITNNYQLQNSMIFLAINTLEILLEPYQLKILMRYIKHIEEWQKKVKTYLLEHLES